MLAHKMAATGRYDGTSRYIRIHWPAFVALYALVIGGLFLMGIGLLQGWAGAVLYGIVLLAIGAYLLLARLRLAHRLHDPKGLQPVEVLYRLSQMQPSDRVVCVDLGLRETAIRVGRHLTSGQVYVVDVYNPESNTGGSLRRSRERAPRAANDPRLAWLDGNIDLLPLPDNSVPAVFLNQILSEFWLHEEQMRLLTEVRRVLIPNGRVLVAERTRTRVNWLALGVEAAGLRPVEEWQGLLQLAGFEIRREEDLEGLMNCFRADKPLPGKGRQLSLDLEYV